MNKILAGFAALVMGGTLAAIIALTNSTDPAPRAIDGELVQAPVATAEYDYHSVWALFEESCRGDEFMDSECSCLMQQVTNQHGMEATACLALMGWDRFAEADAIKARLGPDEIKRATYFYQSKANGACATVPQVQNLGEDGDAVPDDAVVTPVSAASESSGDGGAGKDQPQREPQEGNEKDEDREGNSPNCTRENAIELPGHLGTPILRIRNGALEPLQSLSGGFQSRIGIARSVASSPDILLLDEPTSDLDPEDLSQLGACEIYSSRPVRLGPGPARGFIGNLTVSGSDLPITAGADYVIWDEAQGSITRHALDRHIDLPASTATKIVFLNTDKFPEMPHPEVDVDVRSGDERATVDVDIAGTGWSLLLFLAALQDHQFIDVAFGVWPFTGPLPVNQVMLVPDGPVKLSWGDPEPGEALPKICYLTQLALVTALAERGYTMWEAAAFIQSVIGESRGPNIDLCVLLNARTRLGIPDDGGNWLFDTSNENGPGLNVVQLEQ